MEAAEAASQRRGGALRLVTSMPVRVAGTVLGVVLLFHGVDAGAAMRSLAEVDSGWLLLSALLTAVAYALSVVEWGVLLRVASGGGVGWRRVGSWQVQSVFLGSVVPGGAGGDALRLLHASRAAGVGRGLASLVCSRMAGSCGMAAWALAGALLLRARFGWSTVSAAALLVGVIAVGWLAAFTAAPLVRRGLLVASPRIVARLAWRVMPLTNALRWFRGRGDAICASLAAGMAGWTVNLLALSALAHAVGAEVGPDLFAVALPLSLLTTLVPFAVSGIGLREGVLVGLLVHAGVEPRRRVGRAHRPATAPHRTARRGALAWRGVTRSEAGGRSPHALTGAGGEEEPVAPRCFAGRPAKGYLPFFFFLPLPFLDPLPLAMTCLRDVAAAGEHSRSWCGRLSTHP